MGIIFPGFQPQADARTEQHIRQALAGKFSVEALKGLVIIDPAECLNRDVDVHIVGRPDHVANVIGLNEKIPVGDVVYTDAVRVRAKTPAPFSMQGDRGLLVVRKFDNAVLGVVVAGNDRESLLCPAAACVQVLRP